MVIFISTYTDGTAPQSAEWFYKYITEMACDFRFQKDALKGLSYSICGLGNSLYENNFNKIAIELDTCLAGLQAQRVSPLYCCDENTVRSRHASLEGDVEYWQNNFFEKLDYFLVNRKMNDLNKITSSSCQTETETEATTCCQTKTVESNANTACCGGGVCKSEPKENLSEDSGEANEDDDEESSDQDEEDEEEEANYFSELDEELDDDDKELNNIKKQKNGLVDLEDLGKVMTKISKSKNSNAEPKEMITPLLRQSLTKQGYKLIGSHSGVKLCRWTKSMLRGRGGCYKHTFYGIESHRCMETTPSLACANKCVFCWRHHTNPVGTEWKWKMDGAEFIFDEALQKHYGMIKEFKGVPGVKQERLDEAFNVRHCALSLVGEPIMYPEINKFVDLLHSKNISTFLVTNAQFPDAIKALKPVTQLYVSVDAPTKVSFFYTF